MHLSLVRDILKCEVLCGEDQMDLGVITVLASDMMSDVLAFAEPGALLVTGLTNSQSVRTADIADAVAIVYIRGKRPDDATVALARQLSIPVLVTELGMVDTCRILSSEGLQGVC
jgi:predicted transcriptional regulator